MHIACRKLVKENFLLQPRIGAKLPENMKIYSASDFDTVSLPKKKMSISNPSLYRHNLRSSWAVPYTERASSESNLEVLVEKSTKKASSIEISVPNEEDEDLENALNQIAVMEREQSQEECALEMKEFSMIPGTMNDEFHNEIKDPVNVAQVLVHVPQESRRHDAVSVHSRPETPAWDYYDETPTFSMIPIDLGEDIASSADGPRTPVLPVPTKLQLSSEGTSIQQQSKTDFIDVEVDDVPIVSGQSVPKVRTDHEVKLQRKTGKRSQSKTANHDRVTIDVSQPKEIIELLSFGKVTPKNEPVDVESCIAAVHADKTTAKTKQVLKEQLAGRESEMNVISENQHKLKVVENVQDGSKTKTKQNLQEKGEAVIGDNRNLKSVKPQAVHVLHRKCEESFIGEAVLSHSNIKESEHSTKLDLPVLHRKTRGRPKPK